MAKTWLQWPPVLQEQRPIVLLLYTDTIHLHGEGNMTKI